MPGHPDPAAAVRLAVRADLLDLRGHQVAVAVSGGPDSVALLAGALAVAGPLEVAVASLTVDHGWHPGSAAVAAAVADYARRAGCEPVAVLDGRPPGPRPAGGPEAAARAARYAALDSAATRLGLSAILLGHTLDDQAESVLLGLLRGSGARSLAGMPSRRGVYRRPLLRLRRVVVRAALGDLAPDLPAALPWTDPANSDPRYPRARVRTTLLPTVEDALGPGVIEALARSADLLRADADALDGWAESIVEAVPGATAPHPGGGPPGRPPGTRVASGGWSPDVGRSLTLDLDSLAPLPDALLGRVVRLLAERAGAGATTAVHVAAVLDLIRARPGSGAGPVALPGGVAVRRSRGRLHVDRIGPPGGADPPSEREER